MICKDPKCLKEFTPVHGSQLYCTPVCTNRAKNRRANKKYYASFQRFLRALKETCGCVDCGISDIRVLQFDHTRDKQKKIATLLKIKYAVDELEKCEVVCANCHAIRTWERDETRTTI